MPAPFSRDCQLGSNAITEDSPLPHVAAALQQTQADQDPRDRRVVAAARRRHARGGHTEEIRQILQQAVKGLDVVMINRGVSGELSAQAAPRIKNEVALTEPDLVLWQVGTNDALAYVPLDELEETIIDTLALAEGAQGRRRAGRAAIRRPMEQDRQLPRGARVAAQDRRAGKRDDRAPLRSAAPAGSRRRASGGGLVPGRVSSAAKRAMSASRNTWRGPSRSAFSANRCACVPSRRPRRRRAGHRTRPPSRLRID